MKEKIKNIFINVLLVTIISFGIVHGSSLITNTNQTASNGDTITAAWVNDVNSKIRNLTNNSGGNCPSVRLSVRSTDTSSSSCGVNFPAGVNMQVLTGRSTASTSTPGDINGNHITGQCINGQWRTISFRCMHGGGR